MYRYSFTNPPTPEKVNKNNKGAEIKAALNRLIANRTIGRTAREIAKQLQTVTGLSANYLRQHSVVLQYVASLTKPKEPTPTGSTPAPAPAPAPSGPVGRVEIEQTDNYIKATGDGFATVDEFIAEAGIDLTRWKVSKVTTGRWFMGYKDKNDQAQKIPLYTIKLECSPIDKNAPDFLKVRDEHIALMNSAPAPFYKPLSRAEAVGGCLLVVDAADTHFGKYASMQETGENYNLEIARARVLEGVAGIVGQAVKGYEIEKILLVVGNDVLHVDNTKNETTGGTFQNTSGLWFEMFQTAKQTFVDVIEMLLPIADVDIVYNPSNHDYASGYMLVDSLASWFRNSENVTFNATPDHRKYYQYGNSLIGTTHGDGAKPVDLPGLMAHEAPKLWAETKYRYVYTHHVHHKDRTRFIETKDFIGVTLEAVRSPSATDSWHGKKGYTGVPKAVEGFIHSRNKGQVGRLTYVF